MIFSDFPVLILFYVIHVINTMVRNSSSLSSSFFLLLHRPCLCVLVKTKQKNYPKFLSCNNGGEEAKNCDNWGRNGWSHRC